MTDFFVTRVVCVACQIIINIYLYSKNQLSAARVFNEFGAHRSSIYLATMRFHFCYF